MRYCINRLYYYSTENAIYYKDMYEKIRHFNDLRCKYYNLSLTLHLIVEEMAMEKMANHKNSQK